MGCHDLKEDPKVLGLQNKVLLMGSPNVGKSVFFSALTGIHVVSSNYAGTTVSYMEGKMNLAGQNYSLIDVPGTYTMSANSEAEAIAVQFVRSGPKAVFFVLDSSNLEGSLRLALELREFNIPTVYALNMMDVAERKGIQINLPLLSQKLGGQIVSTVAVKKEGFTEIKQLLEKALQDELPNYPLSAAVIAAIAAVQTMPIQLKIAQMKAKMKMIKVINIGSKPKRFQKKLPK